MFNPFDGIGKFLLAGAILLYLAGAATVGLIWWLS